MRFSITEKLKTLSCMFDRVLNTPKYSNWLSQNKDDLIFIHGDTKVLRILDNSKVVNAVLQVRDFH